MAFLENGSPVATKTGPIATLTTQLAGKATASEIFDLTTSLENIDTTFNTAGQYIVVTNTGTATIFVYDSSNALISELNATTSSTTYTLASAPVTWTAIGSTSNTLSITQVPATITTTNGNAALLQYTSPGNLAPSGGTYNYTAGEVAHVIVVGGGGGGATGGTYVPPNPGGYGGIAYNNTAITLSGTYPITVGAGGAGGPAAPSRVAGQNGSPSTAFGLTATGGQAGQTANYTPGTGANGGPVAVSSAENTQIYKPSDQAKVNAGYFGTGGGPDGGPTRPAGNAGQTGRVIVLKWLNT